MRFDQKLHFTVCLASDARFVQADNEDSDQTADAQADLSLCPAHMSEGTFSHIEAQMIILSLFPTISAHLLTYFEFGCAEPITVFTLNIWTP